MSLRILTVAACPFPVPQGSQVLIEETMRAGMLLGHDVQLVCYGYGIGPDLDGIAIHRCVNIFGRGATAAGPTWRKPFQDGALLARVRRVAKAWKPDVIHAHNYEGLAVALASGGRPVVYHAHNAMADELPHFLGAAGGAVGEAMDRSLPRRADAVIALHERQRDYLVGCGCAAERIHVIPPCIDGSVFQPTDTFEDRPPVVYLGNLDGYQNLPFLGGVMDALRVRMPEARLRVITAGTGRVDGAATLQTPDLPSLIAALRSDGVVAIPRVSWSGFPMKTLNAMAAGKAIVACASAAYGIEDGVTGCVVADGDVEGFADGLSRLMADRALRERMGAAGRDRVLRESSREAMASRLAGVYRG